ncbi:MAG: hypothetical protein Q8899_01735 [Weeping tea tree witches'-broom phytoplasma]|uniref:hypothetical protein n=1 Tax=Candidatus Phytoplasma melaleucae TaxID=2982630 RepID=UPI00293B2AC5|nr:hypothetical protein [Weeping tea tree witches'-broom phytoplasma]
MYKFQLLLIIQILFISLFLISPCYSYFINARANDNINLDIEQEIQKIKNKYQDEQIKNNCDKLLKNINILKEETKKFFQEISNTWINSNSSKSINTQIFEFSSNLRNTLDRQINELNQTNEKKEIDKKILENLNGIKKIVEKIITETNNLLSTTINKIEELATPIVTDKSMKIEELESSSKTYLNNLAKNLQTYLEKVESDIENIITINEESEAKISEFNKNSLKQDDTLKNNLISKQLLSSMKSKVKTVLDIIKERIALKTLEYAFSNLHINYRELITSYKHQEITKKLTQQFKTTKTINEKTLKPSFSTSEAKTLEQIVNDIQNQNVQNEEVQTKCKQILESTKALKENVKLMFPKEKIETINKRLNTVSFEDLLMNLNKNINELEKQETYDSSELQIKANLLTIKTQVESAQKQFKEYFEPFLKKIEEQSAKSIDQLKIEEIKNNFDIFFGSWGEIETFLEKAYKVNQDSEKIAETKTTTYSLEKYIIPTEQILGSKEVIEEIYSMLSSSENFLDKTKAKLENLYEDYQKLLNEYPPQSTSGDSSSEITPSDESNTKEQDDSNQMSFASYLTLVIFFIIIITLILFYIFQKLNKFN